MEELVPALEDRWTQPSELCPHPERWSSTDDDSTEIEVSELIAGLVRGMQPSLVVETGSAWGQTAEAIGKMLVLNGQGKLVSYEIEDERVEFSRDRCDGLPVEIRQESSIDGLKRMIEEKEKAEIVFLDSLFHLRLLELILSVDLLTAGGLVVIHDTAAHHTLWASLERHNLLEGWRWLNLPTPRGVALLQRA